MSGTPGMRHIKPIKPLGPVEVEFGHAVRIARTAKAMAQIDLSKELLTNGTSLSNSRISRLESGQIRISSDEVEALYSCLDLDWDLVARYIAQVSDKKSTLGRPKAPDPEIQTLPADGPSGVWMVQDPEGGNPVAFQYEMEAYAWLAKAMGFKAQFIPYGLS